MQPLQGLVCAYAPADRRAWHRLCWQLDARLADIVRRVSDPTIAAIRLAWWDAVLVEDDRSKGKGEPLADAWRRLAPPLHATAAAETLIDGWRVLLTDEPLGAADLTDFSGSRGGGLFALLAGRSLDEALALAGRRWALWDLAGHSSEPALGEAAMAQARALGLERAALPRDKALKPMRLLDDLVLADLRAGHVPVRGFEGRHYRRLLWRSLIG